MESPESGDIMTAWSLALRDIPSPDYVNTVIVPAFADAGLHVSEDARLLTEAEVKDLPSTWARRLAHGRDHAAFVRFVAISRA